MLSELLIFMILNLKYFSCLNERHMMLQPVFIGFEYP